MVRKTIEITPKLLQTIEDNHVLCNNIVENASMRCEARNLSDPQHQGLIEGQDQQTD